MRSCAIFFSGLFPFVLLFVSGQATASTGAPPNVPAILRLGKTQVEEGRAQGAVVEEALRLLGQVRSSNRKVLRFRVWFGVSDIDPGVVKDRLPVAVGFSIGVPYIIPSVFRRCILQTTSGQNVERATV